MPFPVGVCSGCLDTDGDTVCDVDDCAPDDPARHPGGEEACGDDLDDDCDDLVDEGCPDPDAGVPDLGAPDMAPEADAGPFNFSIDRAAPESGCACDANDAPAQDGWLWVLLLLGARLAREPLRIPAVAAKQP